MDDTKTPSVTPPAPGAAGPGGAQATVPVTAVTPPVLPKEIGGAPGPEPTRYGDWQHKGRVTNF